MMVTGHEQVVSTAYVCDLTFHSPTTISSPVLGQVFEHWFYTGRRSLPQIIKITPLHTQAFWQPDSTMSI
jgi:hypothetical protein